MSNHRVVIEFRWSKRFALGVLAVLVLVAATLSGTAALAHPGQSSPAVSPALTASTVVSYQGKVSVGTVPFNGTGYFKFVIVNADGTSASWSNDGTALGTAPFQPTNSVALSVNNGLFSVLLGDTTQTNMTQPMKPDAFAAPDRMLRVWFNDGVNGFQQLSPDVVVGSSPYALNAEFARTTPNLEKIALLKWYTAINTTQSTFNVGGSALPGAFDGANVWVSKGDGTVSVLRASDGYRVMTPTVGSGLSLGMAFDGVYMWVTNYDNNNVSVIRASDGYHVMTPTVGTHPSGIAFDGSNMWVVNNGDGNISVLRASDASLLMTPTVGANPGPIAFDGSNMWVGAPNKVIVIRASDGYQVMTPTVTTPNRIAFDGVNMWLTDPALNSVSVLRASDGVLIRTVPVGRTPAGVAFDGTNMWVVNNLSGTISVLRASDGALVKVVPVSVFTADIVFDGANMWVGNENGTVSKR